MGSVIMILSGLSLLVLLIGPSRALINTDWKTLNREVTLKYFSPDQYYFSQDPEEIWREMGANITCRAADDGSSFSVTVPSNFHPELTVKMLTHGFASTVAGAGQCSAVEAWMERYSKAVGVVLVDWANLASFTGFGDWDNMVYDWSARNSSWATWTSTLTGAAPSTAAPSARTPCRAECAVTPGPSTTSSTASGSRNCSDPRRAPRWGTATTR